jgi:heme o synthase
MTTTLHRIAETGPAIGKTFVDMPIDQPISATGLPLPLVISTENELSDGPTLRTPREVVNSYLEIAKPRIALMVLITVLMGYALAAEADWNLSLLTLTMAGVAMVAISSSAFNQWWEQLTDRQMQRTKGRPLPSGKMDSSEVLFLGGLLGVVGLLILSYSAGITTTLLAAGTLVSYCVIYTPLKPYSSLCTIIGAIPGAMPPVLGWTAAGGPLGKEALALFLILFVWQFPHFIAIAWKYRDQYAAAGLKMLPTVSTAPRATGLLAFAYSLALIPVSLLPTLWDLAGTAYCVAALVLGLAYAYSAWCFAQGETLKTARGVILTSVIYLPLLLSALVLDHFCLR